MKNLTYFLISTLLFLSITACKKDIEKPSGSIHAKTIYNQAYQENFEVDKIETILIEAKNAYVLLDPFQENITQHISNIKTNGNEVGAYISIGTGENWRDDFSAIEPFLVSEQWGAWAGEYFVNTTNTGIVDVMKLRIDKIAEWGFDWVEFDNMDWAFDDEARNEYGFVVTENEAIAYYNELCDYVHSKGMLCMAKNSVEQANQFDGVLYESFSNDKNWWDQNGTQSFLDANKLVIINHYNETNCNSVYQEYIDIYTPDVSYICEDKNLKKYVHYND